MPTISIIALVIFSIEGSATLRCFALALPSRISGARFALTRPIYCAAAPLTISMISFVIFA